MEAALFSRGGKVSSTEYVVNDFSSVGICAERVTIARAISDGGRAFEVHDEDK